MPKFSKRSIDNLLTCDERLQKVMNEAIKRVDFSVICGHRSKEEQNRAFIEGKSQLQYPASRHNEKPSKAVDIVPYPIDWTNIKRFKQLAGVILEEARKDGVHIVWGGNWHSFKDYPHFELDE